MTATPVERITFLPQAEGAVVARLNYPEGEFSQTASGEIHLTYRHGEKRHWYVNRSLAAFREAAAVFDRFCEEHADDEDTDDDAVWAVLSAQLRRALEEIEPLGDPETSLWSTTVHDTEWGLLSLY
ncbi:MAG: SUKH-4 family immunity protein [Prosthecobacter sp.]